MLVEHAANTDRLRRRLQIALYGSHSHGGMPPLDLPGLRHSEALRTIIEPPYDMTYGAIGKARYQYNQY